MSKLKQTVDEMVRKLAMDDTSKEDRKAAGKAARQRRDELAKFVAQLRGVAPSQSQKSFIDREQQKIRELENIANAP